MIGLERACGILKSELAEHERVRKAADLGDIWVFSTYYDDYDGELIGHPYTTIDKEDGSVGYMTVPPIDNLLRFNGAERLDVSAFGL